MSGTRQQGVQQVERGGVDPLKVVQKNDEGMFLLGDGADEALKNVAEPVLGLGRIERRRFGLFAEDQLDLRDHLCQYTAVATECGGNLGSPPRQPILALREQLPNQASKRLRERAVRNIADNLIELAGDEISALSNNRLIELLDQGRFANPRIARNEEQCCPAVTSLVERLQQIGELSVSTVELLRNQETVGDVMLPQLERFDRSRCCPIAFAPLQIELEPLCALIPILGGFRQQLDHDLGDLLGHGRID